jgi:hypothetical protein
MGRPLVRLRAQWGSSATHTPNTSTQYQTSAHTGPDSQRHVAGDVQARARRETTTTWHVKRCGTAKQTARQQLLLLVHAHLSCHLFSDDWETQACKVAATPCASHLQSDTEISACAVSAQSCKQKTVKPSLGVLQVVIMLS